MKVLLTGATDFVGGDVLYALSSVSDLQVSCLVRHASSSDGIRRILPAARIVVGDLDQTDLVEREAGDSDLVLNLASTSHAASAQAIANGLSHATGSSKYWLQIAGASLVSGSDIANDRYGEPPEASYNDQEDSAKVIELIKSNQKRVTENLVISQDPVKVKTALVVGPLIYGTGRGPGNTRSIQAPEIARNTIERKHGFVLGRGLNVWTNVHVHDLADLFVALIKAAQQGRDGIWNDKGVYHPENGQMSFLDLDRAITEAAHKAGLIDSPEVRETIDPDTANNMTGHGAVLWGTNAVTKSGKAQSVLGWKPSRPSLADELPV
ncbi:Hypothetical protein D9617_1g084110 [Elsinoe fawcettii]|nr:Hypothetical protein D9617_1g084110 [Elsinoe fawcettii]